MENEKISNDAENQFCKIKKESVTNYDETIKL